MKSKLLFLLFLLSYFVYSQNICDLEINPVCSSDTFDVEAPNSSFEGYITSCDGSTYAQQDVAWYHIRILEGTTFTFMLQIQLGDDYDFAVWQNPDCSNIGQADRASFIHEPDAGATQTGLKLNEPDECEGIGNEWYNTPGMVRHLDVQPGDDIYIMIYRPPGVSAGDFSVVFEGTGGDAELDCTIIGDSYGKCDVDGNNQENFVLADFLPDLLADFPTSQFEFYETATGAEQGTGPQVVFPHTINFADNPSEMFVRIEDASGNFMRAVQMFLYVNKPPQLNTPVSLPARCDLDGDGEETFNLTQAQSLLFTGPNLLTFKYYESENDAIIGGGNNIPTPTAYNSGNATIYVRVQTGPLDGNEEGCFSVGEVNLILTTATETEFDLDEEYCLDATPQTLQNISDNGVPGTWFPAVIDTSVLGSSTYTFTPDVNECATEYQIEINIVEGISPQFTLENTFCADSTPPILPLVSDNNMDGTWSPAIIDTSTPGVTTYTFTPNDSNCTIEFEFDIEIIAVPELNNNVQIELCDENFDGIYQYNLEDLNNQLINPTTGITFNYYASQQDIDNNNPIAANQWSNYSFNNLPASIFVIGDNIEGCRSEPVEIQFIEGQGLPLQTAPYEIPFCENESVDLTEFTSNYTSENGVNFTYYLMLNNAENETSPITDINSYFPAGVGSTIYVRLEKIGFCPEIIEVEFIAGQDVLHNAGPFDTIEFCMDETIDLTQFETEIAAENGINFTYYETLSDAENQVNPITTLDEYEASGNGTIYIRLEKADRCDVIVEINYAQRPSPEIIGLEPLNRMICAGQETIEVEVSSNTNNATFVWTWGGNQTQSGNIIQITQAGTYTVTVTDANGCTSTKDLTITASPAPIINLIESGNDYIVVSAESAGGGMLEYSINGVIWQTSPRFDNLVKGEIYTIYVRENGCEITTHQSVILDIPNFISPNDDGYNDQWTIRGMELSPETTIKIFDRYGKIFIDTNFEGNYIWDGKYGGRPLPSGGYWYIMQVPSDGIRVAQKFVGHIMIKNL